MKRSENRDRITAMPFQNHMLAPVSYTHLICDRLAEENLQVKVIHKENGGLSSARNAGIRAAALSLIHISLTDEYPELLFQTHPTWKREVPSSIFHVWSVSSEVPSVPRLLSHRLPSL